MSDMTPEERLQLIGDRLRLAEASKALAGHTTAGMDEAEDVVSYLLGNLDEKLGDTRPDPQVQRCSACQAVKPLDDFETLEGDLLGRSRQCKTCAWLAGRAYLKRHPGIISEHLDRQRKIQQSTRATASRSKSKSPWTAQELEAVADTSRTDAGVAEELGRTYYSVTGRRSMMRKAARKAQKSDQTQTEEEKS